MLSIKSARRAGVPLIAVESADPAQTMKAVFHDLKDGLSTKVVLRWDIVSGIVGLSEEGRKVADQLNNSDPTSTCDPTAALRQLAAYKDPFLVDGVTRDLKKPICFMLNMHRHWNEPDRMQALWNLRDLWKEIGAKLVMPCPIAQLPAELKDDVIVLEDPLPNSEQIIHIIDNVVKDAKDGGAKVKTPEGVELSRMCDTLLGLSEFNAEQVMSMSITATGIDKTGMWDRKCKAVEQTDGLTIYRGREKFADVGGLENGKRILKGAIAGKMRITAVVLIDEIDKAFAAAGSDTSGVTQDQNKVLLTTMQDKHIPGMLFCGPPGTGKTILSKAAANECGVPLVMFDLGGMMSSLVGSSQTRIRQAMKVVLAVSDGRCLFIGCCNRSEGLPPELRRRFNFCNLFFDLPSQEERDPAWKIHKQKFELTAKQCDQVDDTGWTGAEIENACLKAWANGVKLSEAAQDIVPVSKIAGDQITALRKAASGKYISASAPGVFQFKEEQPTGRRKISFGE